MMDFGFWFHMGFEHIADWDALDHILFITALCAIYKASQWKQILVLVTAFTIGHSVTLALSTLDFVYVPTAITEFLIPLSICLTAVYNILQSKQEKIEPNKVTYLFALVFGLIHGLGFSNVLKSLLGSDQSIVVQLLSFNLGLEVGQILIVIILLLISLALHAFLNIKHKYWALAISILVLIPSIIISYQRLLELIN